jgi:hypothetical protein
VQRGHPLLSDGIGFGKGGLRPGNGIVIKMRDEAFGRFPGLFIGFPDNHMQTNTETDRTTVAGGFFTHLGDFFRNLLRGSPR